jgi:dual specificity MAP kinase phosphatase
MKSLHRIRKGIRIVAGRLRRQGLRTTLVWVYGRGLPKLTGVPLLRYSRITPHVYVGPQYNRRGKARLERQGIDHGLNLRVEFDDAAHGLALEHYCYLPTVDDDAPTLEQLDAGAAFIGQALAAGGQVYIHCAGGVGRAPTVAAAYFVSQGLSLDEAIALIQRSRPFINIMPAQMERLRRFEERQGASGKGS